MTQREFEAECESRTIAPAIALENETIKQALRDRDDALVRRLLDEEF